MDKPLIHLVDDDPQMRAMLSRLLSSGGYSVHEYASGAEILAAKDELVSGCILLDISMPGLDGFAVQRALVNAGVNLPIAMMTGTGDFTIAAWQAGVSAFIPKPFGRSEILSVLDRLVADHFIAIAP